MAEDYEEQSTQISGYNEAVFQIKRLNELWLKAEAYAQRGNFPRWNWILDSIYRELYPDLQKLKGKEKRIELHNFYMKRIRSTISRTELYSFLDKRHMLIKLIQDEVGKGAKYQDADDELPD